MIWLSYYDYMIAMIIYQPERYFQPRPPCSGVRRGGDGGDDLGSGKKNIENMTIELSIFSKIKI